MGELGCTLVEEEIIPGLHTSPTSGNGTNASSLTSQGAEQSCEQVLRPRGAQGRGEPGASERSPGSCRVRLEGAGLQRPRLPAGGAAPDARQGPSCGSDQKRPGCSVPGFQQEALPRTPGKDCPAGSDRRAAASRLPAGGAAPDAREGPSCGVPRRQRVRPSRWSVRSGARSGPASPQGGGRVAATS